MKDAKDSYVELYLIFQFEKRTQAHPNIFNMNFGNRTPTIVVLKEGTDSSQGKGQIISNINACLAIQETLKPTLGPLGSDILIVSSNQKTTISNDGATILKLLDVVHPAAKTLVDISRAQDAEVGDGTTSCLLYTSRCV